MLEFLAGATTAVLLTYFLSAFASALAQKALKNPRFAALLEKWLMQLKDGEKEIQGSQGGYRPVNTALGDLLVHTALVDPRVRRTFDSNFLDMISRHATECPAQGMHELLQAFMTNIERQEDLEKARLRKDGVDGESYNLGHAAGRADVAAHLRAIIDPEDTQHLDLDGLLGKVRAHVEG